MRIAFDDFLRIEIESRLSVYEAVLNACRSGAASGTHTQEGRLLGIAFSRLVRQRHPGSVCVIV